MAANGLTRAALARKLGVSRAWVTKTGKPLDPAGAWGVGGDLLVRKSSISRTLEVQLNLGSDRVKARTRVGKSSVRRGEIRCAAAFGHTRVVRLFLERGAAVDQNDGDQLYTPLMAAAANGHFEAVEVLLAAGANCNAEDDYDETVLIKAAASGNVRVVQALLAAGADPAQRGELARLPYEEAAHCGYPEIAELLRAALLARRT